MSNEVASLEAEVKEYKVQLETVQSGLLADPDNTELQNLKTELEEVIALTSTAIAELKPASAATKTTAAKKFPPSPNPHQQQSQPAAPEKWSKEKHPAYQAGYRPPPPQSPITDELPPPPPQNPATFSVNDTVLAKWKTGDRSFYPARITSITGSAAKPVYIVTFKSYSTTETLSAHEIKPLTHPSSNANDAKKRKADASSPSAPTTTSPSNSGVISAAADIDPHLASQARREPSKVSDGPIRPAKVPRKVKANKELEAGKSKWQEFSTKGKGGKGGGVVGKKESMFRTPEGVNARGMFFFLRHSRGQLVGAGILLWCWSSG